MKLSLHRADNFNSDFRKQYNWYLEEASEDVARRFLGAAENTCNYCSPIPNWASDENFAIHSSQEFNRLESRPPFHKLLIFYRYTQRELSVERLIHGVRDLPRRLVEPPDR